VTSLSRPNNGDLDGRALARVLGIDESALGTLAGGPISHALAMSTFRPTDSPRQSFRVDLVGGTIRKIRRTLTAADASRMAAKTAMVGAGQVSRVLSVHGNLVVEQWVEGTPLDGAAPSHDVLREAGVLLARIHTADGVGRDDRSTASDLHDIRADLALLERSGDLSPDHACAILGAAAHHDPGTTAVALMHRDFCGENLVRRSDGSLCSVDNEDLCDGAPDADIVRAWQRWDLDGPARAAFLAGYTAIRRPRLDEGAIVFWSIWSRALSARVRASVGDRVATASHAAALVRLTDPRHAAGEARAVWTTANAS